MDVRMYIALFAYLPLMVGMFAFVSPRKAVIATFLIGWLLLPMRGVAIPNLPDYSKVSAPAIAALMGAMIFDGNRLLSYRPRWIDLPMLIWCVAPFISSIHNDLGLWDGLSSIAETTLNSGLPYLLARVYFDDFAGLKELAMGIFIAGVCYMPLCLIEVRMSAHLHEWVYGFNPSEMTRFADIGIPFYRPTVFMAHGLHVGTFMASATIVAFWLWITGAVKQQWGVPMVAFVIALWITTVLTQVLGAIMLCNGMMAMLWFGRLSKTSILLIVVIAMAPLYMLVRLSGSWAGNEALSLIGGFSKTRSDSLKMRFDNEIPIIDKAKREFAFGWGKWGRFRPINEMGKDFTVTDGFWVIMLGQHGLLGISGYVGFMLIPAFLIWRRVPGRLFDQALIAPILALVAVVLMYLLDSLFNATINPITMLAVGATAAATSLLRRPTPQARFIPMARAARPNLPKETVYGNYQPH